MAVADVNDSSLFPVVLFVHADSYDVGTGNAYDGSVLAAFGHLVVVTFNFRLGVLGRAVVTDVALMLLWMLLLLLLLTLMMKMYWHYAVVSVMKHTVQ